MKILKNAVIAILIAFSLGSFSSMAVADNASAVASITAHIDEALKSIAANDVKAAIAHTKQAKRGKGEMNSEGNAAKIGRLSAHFNKAKRFLKKADLVGAKSELEKAKHGFNALRF